MPGQGRKILRFAQNDREESEALCHSEERPPPYVILRSESAEEALCRARGERFFASLRMTGKKAEPFVILRSGALCHSEVRPPPSVILRSESDEESFFPAMQ